MINIEEPLEYSFLSDDFQLGHVDETVITCRYGYTFDRRTGIRLGRETNTNPDRIRTKSKSTAKTTFLITYGKRDWPKSDRRPLQGFEFTQPDEAAAKAKVISNDPYRDPDYTYAVARRVDQVTTPDRPTWVEFRFSTGEYKPVPFADQTWVVPEHFIHLSPTKSDCVRFFPDPQGDRVIEMGIGRYLQNYCNLSDDEALHWRLILEGPINLKFTRSNPEEIANVYTRKRSDTDREGSSMSCMAYSFDALKHHPASVYGAGDLVVAYLEAKDGSIKGRALVWPERKIVGRCYGDIARMVKALTDEGYTLDGSGHSGDTVGRGGLADARLLKLKEKKGTYIMPYVDYKYNIRSDEQYWRLCAPGHDYDHSPRNTDGTLSVSGEDDTFDCYCCDCTYDHDDGYSFEGNMWCEDCYHSRITSCDRCLVEVHRDSIVSIEPDREYCPVCADRHSSTCNSCEGRYLNNALDGDGHCSDCEIEAEEEETV